MARGGPLRGTRHRSGSDESAGTPVRAALATIVHLGLAGFAAPPGYRYLAENHDPRFRRWTVVAGLLIGLLVNEGVVAPGILEQAAVV